MSVPSRLSRLGVGLVFGALVAGLLWLRWPTFSFPIWNLDEAIHAAVARTLLDGGVLYRDAVDQRTPLTYYVMTAIFAVAGPNNLWAVHFFVTLVIAATAGGLYLLLRRFAGVIAGLWAALLYGLLATGLLYQGDANAYVTEWFVAFFSTAAACTFWLGHWRSERLRIVITGGWLGLAFLSKQPALLDCAAPVLTLAYLHRRTAGAGGRSLLVKWVLLGTGWLLPLLVSCVYFAAHGALHDFVFYAWTYNLVYYGPEITLAERLGSVGVPFIRMFDFAPLLLGVLLVAAGTACYRLVQRQPTDEEKRDNPAMLYFLVWALAALAGAVSGGRGYEHYYIQLLPALCLALGWLLGELTRRAAAPRSPWAVRLCVVLFLGVLLVGLGRDTLVARQRTLPDDTSLRTAQFIRQHSGSEEKIFVWGYQPDIYLLSNRKPAARFVYCSFVSGLIPWSNTALDRDTGYAIVPGSLDDLLSDLERTRPVFFVDCSAGQNRFWHKYPLGKFPRLAAFVRTHYVVVEQQQFVPQGFRVYMLKDAYRHPAPAPAIAPSPLTPPASRTSSVNIFSSHFVEAKVGPVIVNARDAAGRLVRIELLIDGTVFETVSGPRTDGLSVTFEVPFDRYKGRHTLLARAWSDDGSVAQSQAHDTDTSQSLLPGEELGAFGLPLYQARLVPLEISAPYGAQVTQEEGSTVYFAHAPSRLAYPLPDGARGVRGEIGLRPAAYAPTNPTPTDGADFRIEWIKPDGSRTLLFQRLLQPGHVSADRGFIPFRSALPSGAAGRLEFTIDPGPAQNATCDWTFWADLAIETSR